MRRKRTVQARIQVGNGGRGLQHAYITPPDGNLCLAEVDLCLARVPLQLALDAEFTEIDFLLLDNLGEKQNTTLRLISMHKIVMASGDVKVHLQEHPCRPRRWLS